MFATNADLPASVLGKLSDAAATLFRKAFNAAATGGAAHDAAMACAWASAAPSPVTKAMTFATAIRKDSPAVGDVHVDNAGGTGKRKTARTFHEVVEGCAPGTLANLKPVTKVRVEVAKANDEKRQIFGWASVIEKNGVPVEDSQGDIIPLSELEPAAYDYVANSREGDDMHAGAPVSHLIESMVFTPEKQAALGIDLGKVAWWTGWQIDDDAVWQAHKRGERPELSIGGSAIREQI